MKGQAQAKAEYAKVRSLWGDGTQAQAKIHDSYKGESEDQLAHRLGKALDAVGEAMFFVVEDKKHDKVDAVAFPAYKGSGTKEDIKKYMEKTLMPWVQKKQAAIEDVDKEYQKITDLQPVPPPRWVIAAASRAGLMWGNFVDDFRRAPYPKDWDKKGFVPGTGDTLSWREVKANYLEHLDEASRAHQARQGQACAQALPRRLRQVPVLRRVLPRLREVAREATTRPNTTLSTSSAARPRFRTVGSTTSRRRSSSVASSGTPS